MLSKVALMGIFFAYACNGEPVHAGPTLNAPPPAPPVVSLDATRLSTIPDIAEQAIQSVVNISTTKVRQVDSGPMELFDPFFRDFFGSPRAPQAPRTRREQSLGSGVIVREDGIVLTNNHVVGEADEIEVTLHDGSTYDAEIVGTDPHSDVAVVRLKDAPKHLPVLSFGDSSSLRLGETVLAMGNPFGVGQTVTMGIVSATGRANLGIVDYEDFIQTDAAINPGNSGGALVDLRGELVGINTAIVSRTGGYQGVGFAIPSDMAKEIMEDLLGDGSVDRGFLGIGIQDLTDDLADAMELETDDGVLVNDVSPGSAAASAGFERGDVIVEFNGAPMKTTQALRMSVAKAGSDTHFSATVIRGGRRKHLEGELGRLDDDRTPSTSSTPGEPLEGLTVTPLNDDLRRRLGVPDRVHHGVVVTRVDPTSATARAGLRQGDVVLEVNGEPIDSVGALSAALARDEDKALLLVLRNGTTMFLGLRR